MDPVRLAFSLRQTTPLSKVLLASLVLASAACNCGDGGFSQTTSGVTLVKPEGPATEFERTLDLGAARAGNLHTYPIVLRNDGRTAANITRAELITDETTLFLAGAEVLPRLDIKQTFEMELRFLPTAVGDVTGTIIIETDAQDTPKYTIHLTGGASSAVVDACTTKDGSESCAREQEDNQLVVYVGKGKPGEVLKAPLTVRNRGTLPLTVSRVGPTDATSPEFSITPDKGEFTVPGNGSSDFEIVYEPFFGGLVGGFIEIVSNDPNIPRLLVELRGEGIAPRLCMDPMGLLDFGTVDVGVTEERTVTLESCGLEPFTFGQMSLAENEAFTITDPVAAGTTLQPGERVDITLAFSPPSRREFQDRLNFRSETALVAWLNVKGIGVACEFTTQPPNGVAFGQVSIGNTAVRPVTVVNSGTGLCRVSEIREPNAPFALSTAPGTPFDLRPGEIAHLEVSMSPTGTGASVDNVVLVTDGPPHEHPIQVSGLGRTPPPCDIQATPASLVFAGVNVGQKASQKVIVRNTGSEDCYVKAKMKEGSQYSRDFSAQDGGIMVGLQIDSGQSAEVNIDFAPTTPSTHRGILELEYSEDPIFGFPGIPFPLPGQGKSLFLEVPVEGGTLEPELCLEPEELNFGSVAAGATAERSFVIRSCGAGALSLRGVILMPGTSQDFELVTRPRVPQFLQPGATVSVSVRYRPRTPAADFGFIEVLTNDPTRPSAKVRLLGNVTEVCDKQLACAREHLRFPTMEIGRGSSLTLVCQSVGTQPVTVTGANTRPGTSPEFRASVGRTPQTIAAGSTVRLEVTYIPQDTGTDTGSVFIQSDACAEVGATVEGTGKLPTYPACLPPQTFQPVTKWAWEGGNFKPQSRNVGMTPLVINLTDDNGDGRIDENDIPDVIFTSCSSGECCIKCMDVGTGDFSDMDLSGKGMLRAISGKDGKDLWAVTDPTLELTAMTQLAAADLDGDNVPEIVAVKHHFKKGSGDNGMQGKYDTGTLLIFDNQGNVKYESDFWVGHYDTTEQNSAPTLGDLDGDGFPEIFFEGTVFRYNGTRLFDLSEGSGNTTKGAHPILTDLDGDGIPEIFSGRMAYRGNGDIYWTAPNQVGAGIPMILDVDSDGLPEVVLRDRADRYFILNGQTGAIKAGPVTWDLPVDDEGQQEGICPAAPAAADVDGDGNPEFIIPSGDYLRVFRLNGTELWKAPIDDYGGQCGAAGAAAFDFEGYGRYDVVYHDTAHMYVFRGTDGTKIYDAPRNSSTLWETPVIADVDNDGHADILMTNENGILDLPGGTNNPGVRALSNQGNTWPATRRIWNQWSYHITDVNENGTIPRVETPHWESHNNWRANPPLCTRQ